MKCHLAFFAVVCLLTSHVAVAQPLNDDGSSLPDFRARVRFHYREARVSAPASADEDLPAARFIPARQGRVIQGKVRDLPFVFYLRLTRPDRQRKPLVEVNVVNPATGRSIRGFPAKQNLTGDASSFELALSGNQKRRARRAIGGDGWCLITYVNLIVDSVTDD
jgi:hypothetical protein